MSNNQSEDVLTILQCRDLDKKASKQFIKNADGTIEKVSFSAGMNFMWEERKAASVYDLRHILTELMKETEKFIVRGQVKNRERDILFRRINEPGAGIVAVPRHFVMLDIDKQKCPEYLDPASDPESVVRWVIELLPDPFHNVSCFYKFSSSQNVPKKMGDKQDSVVSLHLWFWCNRAVSEVEWKRYFKANPSPVDQALFSPVQIHYTANPIFIEMADPLPQRAGIIEGLVEAVIVPNIPEPVKQKSTPRPESALDVPETRRDSAVKLLLPYYQEGTRDRLAGAIAGTLYRGGWAAEDAADFVYCLAGEAVDTEDESRYNSALRICDAIDNDRPAQGIPVLRDEIGIDKLDEILSLLGVGKPDIPSVIAKLSNTSLPTEIESAVKLLLPLTTVEQSMFIDEIKIKTTCSKSMLNKILKELQRQSRIAGAQDRAVWMVEALLNEQYEGGRLLIRITDGRFYQFNGRYWESMPEDLLRKKLLPYASTWADDDDRHVSALLNESLNILKGRVFVEGDPLRLKSPPPTVINCQNGELWFDESASHTFKPHKPESYLRNCLSVDYDPAAKSPLFDQAVMEIFSNSENPKEMFDHWMEVVGYICQPWRKIAVVMLLIGGGSNGKTSLMTIVEHLLGSSSIMSDRISEIEKNIFKIGALAGKLMLIDDDVDAGTCLPDGFLKKISEEKTMTGQEKYGPPFEFKCRAVPVLLANSNPSLKDLSNGIRRRMMVVPFKRTFEKHEIKPGLFDEIWKTEASGILNHAISGFQRLKIRGRFLEPAACERAKEEWLTRSNALTSFLDEVCVKGKVKQRFKDFYEVFCDYCNEAGVINIPTRQGVRARLEGLGYEFSSLNGYPVVMGILAPDGMGVSREVEAASDADFSLVTDSI